MITDSRTAPGLIRGLGLWPAIAVIVGSMIGQAIFLVASDMARETLPFLPQPYQFTSTAAQAFLRSERSTLIHRAGGDHAWDTVLLLLAQTCTRVASNSSIKH